MKSFKLLLVNVIVFFACKSKYSSLEKGIYADIQTNKGDILIKLYYKKAPMTVANFISLEKGDNPKLPDSIKGKPYYDGTKFHRVIKNFMIQGGDKQGTGRGNAGYKFPDEFPLDEKGNLIYTHNKAGVLSMANSGPNTNSSQFFITHKETPWLDNKHSVFGQVLKGQSVVDTIEKNDFIKKIDIIRVGKKAKKFDAPSVFVYELKNFETKKIEREKKLKKIKEKFLEQKGIKKAIKTFSGLKILELKKGLGIKFNRSKQTTINYYVYLSSGKLIQSTYKKEPFKFILDKQPMIAGVSEVLLKMREGDKKRLFIPYFLAYGNKSYGPFPAKSDIVFDI